MLFPCTKTFILPQRSSLQRSINKTLIIEMKLAVSKKTVDVVRTRYNDKIYHVRDTDTDAILLVAGYYNNSSMIRQSVLVSLSQSC